VFLHCDNLPLFGCLPYLCFHVVRAEELRRFSFNTQSSDALLGGELGYAGDDFQSGTNQILKTSRVQVAFWIAGLAAGAYEAALKYTLERRQFNKPIAQF